MPIDKDKNRPRRQHYHFAHVYLCRRAFGHGKQLLEDLFEDNPSDYLKMRWTIVGLASKPVKDEFIPGDGLEAFPIKIGNDFYGAVIQMPKPERTAEAYFVAIILPVDTDKSASCRFFTLEFSKNKDGSDQTAFGEWDQGAHFNLGSGPVPEKEAFVDSIKERMSNQPKIGNIRI